MLCHKCFQENDDNALFCKHCGAKLVRQEPSSNDLSSILLFVWAVVFFVTSVIQELIIACFDDWYIGGLGVLYNIISIIRCVSYILPAVAIKNQVMRIVAIVIVAIPTIYYIYSIISSIVTEF
jgi:hypothetical protein